MFLEEVPSDVLPSLLPGVCVVIGGGVGDDDGLPRGGAWMHRHRCRRCLRGYVDGVGGGCCYGVSFRGCDRGIALDGEEEVVCNGSSDSTQLYTDVIRIPMILRCTLVQ